MNSWRLLELIYPMEEALRNFNSFRIIFRNTNSCLDGLSPDRLIFTENSISNKKLYLLYDVDTGHYNVITNIKAAMEMTYICNACDTLHDNTHKCEKSSSQCTATPPCTKDQTRYCGTCNGSFLRANHLTLTVKGKVVSVSGMSKL